MNVEDLNWKTWLQQGKQYLKAATPKGEKSKFGPDIRYNLLSMSFEAYIMAILDFHNALPDNHTYTDLMNGLDRVMSIDENLKTTILKFENFQEICSVDKFHISAPTEEELAELKGAIEKIGEIANEVCVVEKAG